MNFKIQRIRDANWLAIVRKMPCHITQDNEHCNGTPVDPHHLTCIPGEGIMGDKAGDDKVLPLCRLHHSTLHGMGEIAFWQMWGINAEAEAMRIWELNNGE